MRTNLKYFLTAVVGRLTNNTVQFFFMSRLSSCPHEPKLPRAFLVFIFSLATVTLSLSKSIAQTASPPPITRILFLVDASSSMMVSWGNEPRMNVAKRILGEIIDTLKRKPNIELGLRVYGSQSIASLNDCYDTKLLVPFGNDNAGIIKESLKNLAPMGITPISMSMEKAATDFPKDVNARNILILITDGAESCDTDPCAVSLALQKNGVFLRPFIIGLNADNSIVANLQCMGAFYNAQDPQGFKMAMQQILNAALNPTYIQVNLLDINNIPSETDAVMTFYDNRNGAIRYNYTHTLNYKGISDTVNLDPVSAYNLVVQTTPPVELKDIELAPKSINKVNMPAPQGFLFIKLQGKTINNNINGKIKCLVKQSDKYGTVTVQEINSSQKLICGKYDLEFLTLPRTRLNNIDISQSKTTTIEIPTPGVLSIQKTVPGYGGILWLNGTNWQKIYSLNEFGGNETIALQPGTYKIIFRSKMTKKTTDTKEQLINITAGGTASAKF